jgi:glycosyltransferase involved in cell wall biosynthesis
MRVLLHCIYYPPEVGGLESHVAALAEGLAARGHEVRVVTSLSRPGLPVEEEIRGVRVRRTPLPRRTPLGWGAHALGSIPSTLRWTRWAEVLHAQAFASVLPVAVATSVVKRPWVASFHTSHFLILAKRQLWDGLLRALVRWPDHALAASREIADVAEGLARDRKVEAMTNGVETDRFRPTHPTLPPKDDERVIVVPRRLFPKNGVEFLVRAVPAIRSEIPGIRVLIIGDGPERSRLEGLARELGVSDRIDFHGAAPHEAMPGLLASGEIAIFPSLMEATSVAALEAMSCERPVLATEVGGLPEIVDDRVGGLVPPRDPGGLARGVVRLLRDPHLVEKGRLARKRVVTHWSNARLVDRHLEIYEDLIAGREVRNPSVMEERGAG